MSVIPLWQVDEHAAYHRRLAGVGDKPVSLYSEVDQWQLTVE
jgi:hypothetical protein